MPNTGQIGVSPYSDMVRHGAREEQTHQDSGRELLLRRVQCWWSAARHRRKREIEPTQTVIYIAS